MSTVADSSLPLQKAVVAVLKADAGVAAIVNGRVYDGVPNNAVMPYVSLGPFQVLPEDADCSEGVTVLMQIDGWAGGPDSVQVKRLGAAAAKVLQNAELVLDEGQRLVNMVIEQIQYLRDPDNITAHAVITVRSQTEPLNP
jgi:predicted NBD/HSP70 family sugar kinase